MCPLYQSGGKKVEETRTRLFEKVSSKRALDPEMFDHTHYEIEANVGEKPYTEEELYGMINPSVTSPGSKCMIILGTNGIGKSELCTYFRKKLRDDRHEKNTLYLHKLASHFDLLEELPKFEIQATGSVDSQAKHQHLREKAQKGNLFAGEVMPKMLAKIDESLMDRFENDKLLRDEFCQFLAEKIRQLGRKSDSDIEATDLNAFTTGSIDKLSREKWMQPILRTMRREDKERSAEILNEAFSKAVYEAAGIPPFSLELKRIAEKTGSRIWIIFEDYDLPYLDNKELLSFVESDQTEIDVQFVIALVPTRWDSLSKMLGGTFADRALFVSLEEGEGGFLNSHSCLEFIKPFLTYHKEFHPDFCRSCGKCSPDMIDTFPFSDLFLQRIFNGLGKDERKPRRFVDLVGSFLEDFAKNGILPFNNRHLLGKIYVPGIETDLQEGYGSLREWFIPADESDSLREYCQVFGIEYEAQVETVERRVLPDEPHPEGKIDEKWEELRSKVRNYLEHPSDTENWGDCGDAIKEGLRSVLDFLTDGHTVSAAWSSMRQPNIVYHFPGRDSVLSPTAKKGAIRFLFDPKMMPIKVGEELLAIGYRNKSVEEGLTLDLGQAVTPMIEDWRARIREYYWGQSFGAGNTDFRGLVELCQELLEDFADPFSLGNVRDYREPALVDKEHVDRLSKEIVELLDQRKHVLELMKWTHSIGGSFYVTNEFDPWKRIRDFRSSKVEKILDSKLRVKGSGPKVELVEVLKSTYKLAKRLHESKDIVDLSSEKVTPVLDLLTNEKVTDDGIPVIEQASALSTLDRTSLKPRLVDLSKMDPDDFTSLTAKLDVFCNGQARGLQALQSIDLCQDRLLHCLLQVVESAVFERWCNGTNGSDRSLLGFCRGLVEESRRDSDRRSAEQMEAARERLESINDVINVLIEKGEMEKDSKTVALEKLKSLEEIQAAMGRSDFKLRSYVKGQIRLSDAIRDFNDTVRIVDERGIGSLTSKASNMESKPDLKNVKSYIRTRNGIRVKIGKEAPRIGKQRMEKLLKNEGIPLSDLQDDELKDIMNSKLRDALSLVLRKK